MNTTSREHNDPSPPYRRAADDWEEWEDDDIVTPIDTAEQVLIAAPPASSRATKTSSSRISRYPTSKLKRLKSRQRQQAQNAKAGIKLITDMTTFRPRGHVAHHIRTPDGRVTTKFVDAAALKALEGEPNSASVGNWNWLRKNRGSPASASPQHSARTPDQAISPEDRPILIGLSVPSEEMASREMSPQTATTASPQTPLGAQSSSSRSDRNGRQAASSPLARNQPVSVWSPDTPDTASSFNSRHASSVYSQATGPQPANRGDVPPVPALPTTYRKAPHQRLISLEVGADDDDGGTPCTLFEEDGIPSPQKRAKSKSFAITPDSAGSRSHGWWDHVVTPFTDKRLTFTSRRPKLESPKEEAKDEPWNGNANESRSQSRPSKPSPIMVQAPIVRAPTPRRTPSPRTDASGPPTTQSSLATTGTVMQEKPRIVVTGVLPSDQHDVPSEQPPPYSPPQRQGDAPIRYRAVFPPGHPLQAQFPPSPGPMSPGLAATMTSQGATQMSEIPITPTARSYTPPAHAPLPARPVGTALPQEHSHEERDRVERERELERRRQEKEEGGKNPLGLLWKARSCIPRGGSSGGAAAVGSKRWIAVAGGAIALVVLAIVLAVVLTRPHDSPDVAELSNWVNLTDFPAMPTGVLTVVGPDNTVSTSSCTSPSTLWSCALPKEDHDSVAPYKPNQPTVIMQIQWDNGTKEAWNIPNGDPPASISQRGISAASFASGLVRSRQTNDGFTPDPSPPAFEEMWFLGDTTDNVASDQKAGEPTPFYISLLKSVDDEIATPKLEGRADSGLNVSEIVPPPDLEEDGTPTPAMLLPRPVQQPLRLFDRGLPTEHYGFYTYFKRTIFLKSVTALNDTADDDDVPLDEGGGCAKTEANFLVTWAEMRMLVQIWTRTLEDESKLLPSDGPEDEESSEKDEASKELIRPGTMPYPVTVSLDTHGGDKDLKTTWDWPMDERQQLDMDNAELLVNKMDEGGTWVNRARGGDEKFGGFDGGSGGCKCEWVNWV